MKLTVILLIFLFQNASGQVDSGAPSWSPDGKSFVYTSNESRNSDLYVYNFESKTNSQITNSDSSEWTPSWSADGKYIAFISDRDGNRELYVYDIKLKSAKRLTNSNLIEAAPSWSADSKKILFVSFDPSNNSRQIFESTLRGDLVLQEFDTSRSYIYPRVSNDGKMLLFGSKMNKVGEAFHIWTRNVATGKMEQLENTPLVSYNPSWSANGKKILFINQSERDISTAAIYMMNNDGSDLVQILSCENGCFQARLSPDGKSILYKNGWAGKNKGVYLFDLETKSNSVIIGD